MHAMLLNDISGCRRAGFTRANPHGFTDRRQENLAVTGFSGAAYIGDGFDDGLGRGVVQNDFDAQLRDELDAVFGSAEVFRVAALPAVTRHLGDGDPLHAKTRDGHLQVVELPRSNDGSDHFHRFRIVIRWIARTGRAYPPYRSVFKPCDRSAGSMRAPRRPGTGRCGAKEGGTCAYAPQIGATTRSSPQNGERNGKLVRRPLVEMPKVEELLRSLMQGLPPGLVSGAGGLREDIENNFRAVLRANLTKLDLAGRDEFDAQRKVLERTRARLEELEKRVALLEAGSGTR